MKNLRTIVLAAGKGTRMKSEIPKVLHLVCGSPIIHYVLRIAQGIGSLKTYIVLGHKKEEIIQHLPPQVQVIQQKQLLGTADAISSAARYFNRYAGDVLVLCGDTPLLSKEIVRELVKKHKRSKASCTFLTAVLLNPNGYGRVIRAENGSAVAIREDKDAVGLERNIAEINTGVYCFKAKELFQTLKSVKMNQRKKEFYLTTLIELFYEGGRKVETLPVEDPNEALGINTKEDLAIAEDIMRGRIIKEYMKQGVSVTDPKTTYIDQNVKFGKDCTVMPFSYIEENVRIGDHCAIGPFAHLRSGTRIGNNVVVGNFTEIVRTRIGNHAFMKHFSYLGDAIVGNNVNIGAGTVTANFDGKQKNVTRIADHAFIGSDAVLVAPVRIGKRAIVGAGSVVPKGKNVPDGMIAYGVPVQINRKEKAA